jgi:hypothetical protein
MMFEETCQYVKVIIALNQKDPLRDDHLTSMLSRRAISISLGTNRIASI